MSLSDDEKSFANISITATGMKRFRSRRASASKISSLADKTATVEDETKNTSGSSDDPFNDMSTTASGVDSDRGLESDRSSLTSEKYLDDEYIQQSAVKALERRQAKAAAMINSSDSCAASTDGFDEMTESEQGGTSDKDSSQGREDAFCDSDFSGIEDEDMNDIGANILRSGAEFLQPATLERGEFKINRNNLHQTFIESERQHNNFFGENLGIVSELTLPSDVVIPDMLRNEYISMFGQASSTLAAVDTKPQSPLNTCVKKDLDDTDIEIEQYCNLVSACVKRHIHQLRQRKSLKSGGRHSLARQNELLELSHSLEEELLGSRHSSMLLQVSEHSVLLSGETDQQECKLRSSVHQKDGEEVRHSEKAIFDAYRSRSSSNLNTTKRDHSTLCIMVSSALALIFALIVILIELLRFNEFRLNDTSFSLT